MTASKQISVNERGWLIIVLSAIAVFLFSIHRVTTFDTFFGLRIGEFVVKHGTIPLHEPFSWSAQGRYIIPYEWLAQVLVYLLFQLGQFKALELYVATTLTIFYLLVFVINNHALKRDLVGSLLLSGLLTMSVYEFFSARPQVVAFVGLVFMLYLVLLFIIQKKNRLYWLLPLTYLWANSHASFILIFFFLVSYAFLGRWYLDIKRQHDHARLVTKTLLLYVGYCAAITLLPPLWYRPYELLWRFSHDLPFMTRFISEWGPLTISPAYQIYYVFSFVIIVGICIARCVKKEHRSSLLLVLPLLAIAIASFQAIRHYPLGITALFLMLSFFLPNMNVHGHHRVLNIGIVATALITIIWLGWNKRAPMNDTIWTIPSMEIDRDIDYINHAQFRGHMFNEFSAGGYFLYALYPQYQTYFDGRADIYSCCEMRDFWPLIVAKNGPRDEFKKLMYQYIEKNKFSYLLIPTYTYNPLEYNTTNLMADFLLDDPHWRLVYFSDFLQILVRDDGKNQEIFDQGFTAITPYRFTQYRSGHENDAKEEFERMLERTDSATGRSALGQIDLKLDNIENARQEFERAIRLKPRLGKAYVGLGKVDLQLHHQQDAISHFKHAIAVAPYLGEAYILLAKTYSELGQKDLARHVLETGLKQNIDFLSLKEMVRLLDIFSH